MTQNSAVPSTSDGRCRTKVFRRLLAASLSLVAAAGALAGGPSPADWSDEVIYQVLTDRFYDGDPSNNSTGTTYNPASGTASHGGDWDGIRAKIPYMKALGVTAVWISPVPKNVNGAYHGYHAQDFNVAAPNFGGQAALTRLSNDLKTSGIRLVLDVVPNHGGDLIRNNSPYRVPPNSYTLSYRNGANLHANPFASLDCWHAQGSIGNYSGNEQILGELSGLDDLKTERADIRTTLTQIFNDWITKTDCDSFRIDTVKHVDMAFWQTWSNDIRSHAATLGKNNFFLFGEVFDGSSPFVGSFTGTKAGGAFALDSVLDYPMYYRTNDVFARQTAGAQSIMDYYGWQSFDYDPATIGRLVSNLDNHDNVRFLNSAQANGNRGRLRAALAFQLLSPGVPSVYYGTEQWFDGGNDPGCREDMFDGSYEQGPSLGDNFNMSSDGFRYFRKLAQLRRELKALRRGTITGRQVQSSPGAFAFSRITPGEPEVIVALNTSDNAVNGAAWATNYSQGTVLVDALDPTLSVTVGSGGTIPSGVALPANGVRVFVPGSALPNFDPAVESASIPHGSRPSSLSQPLVLTFTEPMTTATLCQALVTTPTLTSAATFDFDPTGQTVTITPPGTGWPSDGNGLFRLGLTEAATDSTGRPLSGGYELLWDFIEGIAPPLPLTDPTIDGTIAADPRYSALASVQTVQTQFGDNTAGSIDSNISGSELDNLRIAETTGTLYLGIAGNMENNGNCVAILFDLDGSAATGTNNLNDTGGATEWLSGNQGAAGTILPAGFGCDAAIVVSANGGAALQAWLYRWSAGGTLAEERALGTIAGTSGQPTRGVLEGTFNGTVHQVSLGLNNSHTGPVSVGLAAASPDGTAAGTGLELALPRAIFAGNANRRILVGLSGPTGFWSNQFLPPVTPSDNLGWQPDLGTTGVLPYTLPAVPVTLIKFELD